MCASCTVCKILSILDHAWRNNISPIWHVFSRHSINIHIWAFQLFVGTQVPDKLPEWVPRKWISRLRQSYCYHVLFLGLVTLISAVFFSFTCNVWVTVHQFTMTVKYNSGRMSRTTKANSQFYVILADFDQNLYKWVSQMNLLIAENLSQIQTHPSNHSHLCPLKCHLIFFPYRPCLTPMLCNTTAVQPPWH